MGSSSALDGVSEGSTVGSGDSVGSAVGAWVCSTVAAVTVGVRGVAEAGASGSQALSASMPSRSKAIPPAT